MNEPAAAGRPPSLEVQLSVRRGREALGFYRDAFDARELYRFEGDDEVVAQLVIGETRFWVEDESPEHGNFSPETLGRATERLLLVVEDPHAAVARAVTAGAVELQPVAEAHGWLLGRILDPFGHHWEIGRPLTAWPPPGDHVGG